MGLNKKYTPSVLFLKLQRKSFKNFEKNKEMLFKSLYIS